MSRLWGRAFLCSPELRVPHLHPLPPPSGWDSPSSERWFSPTPLTQVFLHPRDRPPTFQVFPGLATALGATGICSCYWLPDDVIAAQ